MKIILNSGLISITAETKEENKVLFDVANEQNFGKGESQKIAYTYKKARATNKGKKYPKREVVECDVIGCNARVASLALHRLMAHGIKKDGTIANKVPFGKGGIRVPKDIAVRLPNGTYRLAKKGGLLDD